VYRLISPGGNPGGTPNRAPGRNSNGSASGGRSPGSAKSPLVITDRPRRAPRAMLSDQATV
jgi:hypothetical protein